MYRIYKNTIFSRISLNWPSYYKLNVKTMRSEMFFQHEMKFMELF